MLSELLWLPQLAIVTVAAVHSWPTHRDLSFRRNLELGLAEQEAVP
ncbi:hypothetical protein [Mycobacterium paraseoulense]|nr:hypothetical protein [Mycobacterium paraseoulense]MCV7396934.1 hypothetical protein [Mycobacterium paraseoulense]BBZ69198.1 hypothetical protein MPRS_02910 [Mycobacterium paraseoulense]